MRTPTWETSTGALVALLNSRRPLTKADAYTLTLPTGTVHRWSGADVPLQLGSHLHALGPGIQRSRCRWVVGVEVSTLDITLTDNVGTLINGQPLMAAIRAQALTGARVLLERVFWGEGDAGPVGALHWFSGRIADVPQVDRWAARLTVTSDIDLLSVQVPRDVYQPGCLNTVYDSLCGASRAANTVSGTATSATDARRITFSAGLAQPDGWADMGVIRFDTGANAGMARTVKRHASGAITVLQPWPWSVAAGDLFSITAGCDKKQETCAGKFANLSRYRGMPYIPVAETVT